MQPNILLQKMGAFYLDWTAAYNAGRATKLHHNNLAATLKRIISERKSHPNASVENICEKVMRAKSKTLSESSPQAVDMDGKSPLATRDVQQKKTQDSAVEQELLELSRKVLSDKKGRDIVAKLKEKDPEFNACFQLTDVNFEQGAQFLGAARQEWYRQLFATASSTQSKQEKQTIATSICSSQLMRFNTEITKLLSQQNAETLKQKMQELENIHAEVLESLRISTLYLKSVLHQDKLAEELHSATLGVLRTSFACLLFSAKSIDATQFAVLMLETLTVMAPKVHAGGVPSKNTQSLLVMIREKLNDVNQRIEKGQVVVSSRQRDFIQQLRDITNSLDEFDGKHVSKLKSIQKDLQVACSDFRREVYGSDVLQIYSDRYLLAKASDRGVETYLSKVFDFAQSTCLKPEYSGRQTKEWEDKELAEEIINRKQVHAIFSLLRALGQKAGLKELPEDNLPNPVEWARATNLFLDILRTHRVTLTPRLVSMLDALDQTGEKIEAAITLLSNPEIIRKVQERFHDAYRKLFSSFTNLFLDSDVYKNQPQEALVGYPCPTIECVATPLSGSPTHALSALKINPTGDIKTNSASLYWLEEMKEVKASGTYMFQISGPFDPLQKAITLSLVKLVEGQPGKSKDETVEIGYTKYKVTTTTTEMQLQFVPDLFKGWNIKGKKVTVNVTKDKTTTDNYTFYDWSGWNTQLQDQQTKWQKEKLPLRVLPEAFDLQGKYVSDANARLTFADFMMYQLNNYIMHQKSNWPAQIFPKLTTTLKDSYVTYQTWSTYLNALLQLNRLGYIKLEDNRFLDVLASTTLEGALNPLDNLYTTLTTNFRQEEIGKPNANNPIRSRQVKPLEKSPEAVVRENFGQVKAPDYTLGLQDNETRSWDFISRVRHNLLHWMLENDVPAQRFHGTKPSAFFRPLHSDEQQRLLQHTLSDVPAPIVCEVLDPINIEQRSQQGMQQQLVTILATCSRKFREPSDQQYQVILVQYGSHHCGALVLNSSGISMQAKYFDVTEPLIPLCISNALRAYYKIEEIPADVLNFTSPQIDFHDSAAGSLLIASIEAYIKTKKILPANFPLAQRKAHDMLTLQQWNAPAKPLEKAEHRVTNPLTQLIHHLLSFNTARFLFPFATAGLGAYIGYRLKHREAGASVGFATGLGISLAARPRQIEPKKTLTPSELQKDQEAIKFASEAQKVSANDEIGKLVAVYQCGYFETFYRQLDQFTGNLYALATALAESKIVTPALSCFEHAQTLNPNPDNHDCFLIMVELYDGVKLSDRAREIIKTIDINKLSQDKKASFQALKTKLTAGK